MSEWVLMIAHVVLVSLRAVEFLLKPVALTVFLKQVFGECCAGEE